MNQAPIGTPETTRIATIDALTGIALLDGFVVNLVTKFRKSIFEQYIVLT